MPQRYRRIVALNYLSFLSLGLISGVLGPSLPSLARRMDIGLGMAGGLISGLSVGYLIGGLVAGAVADAFGRRPVYLTGLGLTGISLLAILSAPSLAMGLLAAFFLGLGQGSIDVVVHVVTGDATLEDRGAALNRLHVFFGLGALIGPVWAGYGLKALDSLWPAFVPIAALTLLIAFGVALARLPAHSLTHETPASNARAIISSRTFWALAAFFFLYVGVEVGVGTWTFAFLSEKLGTGVTLASWATSGFYLALTAGRLAGSRLVGRRMADEKLVLLGVGGAVAGALLLWAAGVSAAIAPFVVAVLLMGFCFGPIYPTAMGVAQRRYAEAIGTTVGLITVGAGLGATSLPWFQGWLLARGGLLGGVGVTGVGMLALLVVGCAVFRWSSKQ